MEDVSSNYNESVVSSLVIPPPPPSVAITPVKKSATQVDNNTSSNYPHLSQALDDEDGYFDPADPSVEASLQELLQEINNLLSTLIMSLMYKLYPPTNPYPTFECQEQRVIMSSQIQMKGSTPPSKSQDRSMVVHLNQLIKKLITTSNFIWTHSLLLARLKVYQSSNQ